MDILTDLQPLIQKSGEQNVQHLKVFRQVTPEAMELLKARVSSQVEQLKKNNLRDTLADTCHRSSENVVF